MLAFIGFIALLIFGKFLWDTYATGNTDKDWESYKRNEPEKAARIINSDTFDMSTDYKPNPRHQKDSLQILALTFECDASEVEENYKSIHREALAGGLGNIEQFKQSMKDLKHEKHKQAVKFKIDPDNTPAAFMEKWMQEVLDDYSERTDDKTGVNSKAQSEEISKALAKFGITTRDNYGIIINGNRSKTTTSKLQSNPSHRTASLLKLARRCRCSDVDWVKEVFTGNFMRDNKVSVKEAKLVIQTLNSWIQDEAATLNISPLDTTAAIQVEWINDYIDNKDFSARWDTKADMLEDMYSLNPDFELAYRYGDAHKQREFLLDNIDFMSYVQRRTKEFDLEAHTIIAYANASIKEKDYDRVFELLDKGFALNDESANAELHNTRGKALLATFKTEEALADFDKAIEITLREGINAKHLSEFIENKAEAERRIKARDESAAAIGKALSAMQSVPATKKFVPAEKPESADKALDSIKADAKQSVSKSGYVRKTITPVKQEEPEQQKDSFEAGDEVAL